MKFPTQAKNSQLCKNRFTLPTVPSGGWFEFQTWLKVRISTTYQPRLKFGGNPDVSTSAFQPQPRLKFG